MKNVEKEGKKKETLHFALDKQICIKFNSLLEKRQLYEEKKGKIISKKLTATKGIEEALLFFIDMDVNPVEFKTNDLKKMLNNLDSNMFKLRDTIFSFMQVQEKKMITKFDNYDKYFVEINKLFAFSNQRQILTHSLLMSIIENTIEDKSDIKNIIDNYKKKLEIAKEILK